MSFFRLLPPTGRIIGSAGSLSDVASILRHAKPGRYRVQAVSLASFSPGRWLNPWGAAIRDDDGRVTLRRGCTQ
jgi:hypothetical protein